MQALVEQLRQQQAELASTQAVPVLSAPAPTDDATPETEGVTARALEDVPETESGEMAVAEPSLEASKESNIRRESVKKNAEQVMRNTEQYIAVEYDCRAVHIGTNEQSGEARGGLREKGEVQKT